MKYKVIGYRNEPEFSMTTIDSRRSFMYVCSEEHTIYEVLLEEQYLKRDNTLITSSRCKMVCTPTQYIFITWIPKNELNIESKNSSLVDDSIIGEFKYHDILTDISTGSEVFSFEEVYYSHRCPEGIGNYCINQSLFERLPSSRSIWIFYEISTLQRLLHEFHIPTYKTDCSDKLPDCINESIVVVGNKYKFEIKDILDRIK